MLRLSGPVKKFISKNHAKLTNFRRLTKIGIDEFKKNVQTVFCELNSINVKVVCIPIAPACSEYIKHSPRIQKNIDDYNKVLESSCHLFLKEMYSGAPLEEIFLTDFHHLNSKGHDVVFEFLKNRELV